MKNFAFQIILSMSTWKAEDTQVEGNQQYNFSVDKTGLVDALVYKKHIYYPEHGPSLEFNP